MTHFPIYIFRARQIPNSSTHDLFIHDLVHQSAGWSLYDRGATRRLPVLNGYPPTLAEQYPGTHEYLRLFCTGTHRVSGGCPGPKYSALKLSPAAGSNNSKPGNTSTVRHSPSPPDGDTRVVSRNFLSIEGHHKLFALFTELKNATIWSASRRGERVPSSSRATKLKARTVRRPERARSAHHVTPDLRYTRERAGEVGQRFSHKTGRSGAKENGK